MRPLRLAVFTNQFPGKVSTFFARDMRALIDAGIEVDVFAIYPHEPELWSHVPDILSEDVLPRERVHHLSLREGLAAFEPGRLAAASGFFRDTAAVAASAVRFGPTALAKSMYVAPHAFRWAHDFGDRYDHVMAYWGNYPATCAYLFHRLAGRPIPFTLCVHAQIDLYERPVFLAEKLAYADSIVTVCEYNRRYMRDHYPAIYDDIADRIDVNYRGLDLAEFPYRPDGRNAKRVVAVGRLSEEKAYDCLLQSIAELGRRGVDVELDLVGDGPERAALTRLAERLQIQGKVTFHGWQLSEGVRRAISEAAVLTQASRVEGLPTVVEEAMALGTPVIGSSVGGIPELLDDGRCGLIIPPRDVRALADALETMLTNPALRATFAERGRRRAEDMLDMWRNGARFADGLRATTRRSTPVVSIHSRDSVPAARARRIS